MNTIACGGNQETLCRDFNECIMVNAIDSVVLVLRIDQRVTYAEQGRSVPSHGPGLKTFNGETGEWNFATSRQDVPFGLSFWPILKIILFNE